MNPMDLEPVPRLGMESASPDGSARDTPAFAAVAAEIAKLDSVQAGEVSWSTVRDQAMRVLAGSSDLLVAAYLAHALQRTHGLAGLAAGLALVRNLMKERWPTLQPPEDRLRARRSALQWLGERAARQMAACVPDPDASAACGRFAHELADMCRSRFDGADAGFAALTRLLAVPDQHAAISEGDGHAEERPVEDSASPAREPMLGSRVQAIRRLTEAALYFQRCEPHSPIGPLLQRALAWSGKGFAEVFAELLSGSPEAKTGIWKSLGIGPDNERP